MEDHLRQTEGLIETDMVLSRALNSKKRLLVASQNGPLSPR